MVGDPPGDGAARVDAATEGLLGPLADGLVDGLEVTGAALRAAGALVEVVGVVEQAVTVASEVSGTRTAARARRRTR